MFHLLGTMIIGLIVGALAKLIMPGRDPGGIIVTMLLGLAGSLIGGFFGRLLGLYGPGQGAGFIVSTLGRFSYWRCTGRSIRTARRQSVCIDRLRLALLSPGGPLFGRFHMAGTGRGGDSGRRAQPLTG